LSDKKGLIGACVVLSDSGQFFDSVNFNGRINMQQLTVGLFGFGKTGRLVATELLNDPELSLEWVVRGSHRDEHKFASRRLGFEDDRGAIFAVGDLDKDFFRRNRVDVIIDFSQSGGVRAYMAAADEGIRIVSAISKYEDEDLKVLTKLGKKTAVLYSPNITLGINFLLIASQVLQSIAPHADIEIVEEHFRDKKGVSGTAKKLASVLGLDEARRVNSIRVGGIVGRHEIIFGLPNQTIRLVHESINRAAFGQGAIFAAKWLQDKAPGVYSMEHVISEMFRKNLPVY
jgi:4-hydroxy-tetrahydrodipicolinate reductase